MPDLHDTSVATWLRSGDWDQSATSWPPAFRPIESQDANAARLEALGTRLDRVAAVNPCALSAALRASDTRRRLVALVAQLGGGRTLRLFHWLSEAKLPERSAITGGLLGDDSPDGRALRAAMRSLTAPAVLTRMVSAARLAALKAAATAAAEEVV